jgi:hypothetical protein
MQRPLQARTLSEGRRAPNARRRDRPVNREAWRDVPPLLIAETLAIHSHESFPLGRVEHPPFDRSRNDIPPMPISDGQFIRGASIGNDFFTPLRFAIDELRGAKAR